MKDPFAQSRRIRFHFCRMGKHLMAAAKTQHSRTQWLTVLSIQLPGYERIYVQIQHAASAGTAGIRINRLVPAYTPWFIVNHGFTGNLFYGKICGRGGYKGVKNPLIIFNKAHHKNRYRQGRLKLQCFFFSVFFFSKLLRIYLQSFRTRVNITHNKK